MCTAVVSFEPGSRFPVLLVGVRDEFASRPWEPPGRHWADRPALVGGRDLLAGGTWLAVHPAVPRAACILNGHGRLAPEGIRASRGELPLRLAADGALDDLETKRYDPFHLLGADPDGVRMWSWDGDELTERALSPGLHLVVNSGLEGLDDPAPGPGAADMAARLAHFRPLLAAAPRPEPGDGPTAVAWDRWLPLLDGDGLALDDPRALVLSRDFGDGRIWGTGSISLVALGRDGLRYDFSGTPGDPRAWRTVLPA